MATRDSLNQPAGAGAVLTEDPTKPSVPVTAQGELPNGTKAGGMPVTRSVGAAK